MLGFSRQLADDSPQQRSAHLQRSLFVCWERLPGKKNRRSRRLVERLRLHERFQISGRQRGLLQLFGSRSNRVVGLGEVQHRVLDSTEIYGDCELDDEVKCLRTYFIMY